MVEPGPLPVEQQVHPDRLLDALLSDQERHELVEDLCLLVQEDHLYRLVEEVLCQQVQLEHHDLEEVEVLLYLVVLGVLYLAVLEALSRQAVLEPLSQVEVEVLSRVEVVVLSQVALGHYL